MLHTVEYSLFSIGTSLYDHVKIIFLNIFKILKKN